jgi:FkbM family methyltransferase
MGKLKNKFLYLIQVLQFSINYLTNKNFNEKKIVRFKVKNEINIFDIGSNLGSYIKFVSNQNKNKKINFYSFEPDKNLILVQKKLKLPSSHNLITNNIGISNENKQKQFFRRSVSSQSSFLNDSRSKDISKLEEKLNIRTVRLDDYCFDKNIDYIDILKIDTEGLELEVLISGSKMIINKKIGIIKIELDSKFDSIVTLLASSGYELMGITNTTYIQNKIFIFDAYFKST